MDEEQMKKLKMWIRDLQDLAVLLDNHLRKISIVPPPKLPSIVFEKL